MPDPTPDWYPSALRVKAAQVFSPFDRYEAAQVACDVPPDRAKRNAALRALGPLVYAARCPGNFIKIGFSTRVPARIVSIHGELLAFRSGTYYDEQAIHARLIDHLHHGWEWYNPTPEVLAVVNEMRADLGLEPVAA